MIEAMTPFTDPVASERARRAAQVRNSPNKDGTEKIRKVDPTTTEIDYSPDEVEFALAITEYKQQNGRVFLTNSEILRIVTNLGYQKVGLNA